MDDNSVSQESILTPSLGEVTSLNDNYKIGRSLVFNPQTRADYSQAVSLLEQVIAEDQNNPGANVALIYALTKLDKYAEAKKYIEAIRPFRDQFSGKDALWFEALDAKVFDDHVREIEGWDTLVELYPSDWWAWYEYGAAHYVRGEYKETVDKLARALEVGGDNVKWDVSYIHYVRSKSHYRICEYEESIVAAIHGLENPLTRRATYYRKTMAELALGLVNDPEMAMQTYRHFSESEGRSETYVLAGIANFFFEASEYELAIKYARTAVEIAPEAYPSWLLGYSLIENGNLQEGLQVLKNTVALHPDVAGAHAGLGWAFYRLERLEEARTSLLKAQALTSRTHFGYKRDLAYVEEALRDPDVLRAPPLRWLGD